MSAERFLLAICLAVGAGLLVGGISTLLHADHPWIFAASTAGGSLVGSAFGAVVVSGIRGRRP